MAEEGKRKNKNYVKIRLNLKEYLQINSLTKEHIYCKIFWILPAKIEWLPISKKAGGTPAFFLKAIFHNLTGLVYQLFIVIIGK